MYKEKRCIVLLALIIFLFSLSLVEARDPNDPIVSGDDILVFSDGGPNIPKNKTKPVMKDIEPPPPGELPKYTKRKEMLNGVEVTIKRNLKDRVIEIYGTYPPREFLAYNASVHIMAMPK